MRMSQLPPFHFQVSVDGCHPASQCKVQQGARQRHKRCHQYYTENRVDACHCQLEHWMLSRGPCQQQAHVRRQTKTIRFVASYLIYLLGDCEKKSLWLNYSICLWTCSRFHSLVEVFNARTIYSQGTQSTQGFPQSVSFHKTFVCCRVEEGARSLCLNHDADTCKACRSGACTRRKHLMSGLAQGAISGSLRIL